MRNVIRRRLWLVPVVLSAMAPVLWAASIEAPSAPAGQPATAAPTVQAAPDAAPQGLLPMSRGAAPLAGLAEPPSIPWVRVVSGTAAVIALICFGVYGLKRMNGGLPFTRGRHMELLESRPLGRGVQIYLVRVGERVLVLGHADGEVSCLTELGSEELPPAPADAPKPVRGFTSLLSKAMGVRQ